MARVACLHDVSGIVKDIISPNKAFINFVHGPKWDNIAFLAHAQFHHEGRHIPPNRTLTEYIRPGTTVKFSCEESQEMKKDVPCHWIATTCWAVDESPLNSALVMKGLDDVAGKVKKLGKRHGIISVFDGTNHASDILFLASRFYIDGKRFAAWKCLVAELQLNDVVYVDAIPCIPEENDEKCRWFATCVYKGRRPKIVHDNGGNNMHKAQYRGEMGHQMEEANDFRNQYLEFINLHMHNVRTVYVVGGGTILRIIDEEFGIIMGEFKKNVFQTMFFHRKHFFLFGTSLVDCDIRALLSEQDQVKFVAVGAPPGFATDLIAVQVAIQK